MEHKLIQGGDQYLPFARSRIKALRATGLKYASQRFVTPDGIEVNVQIAGDQEYIRLNGGIESILSGVTKGGELITLPIPPDSPPGTVAKTTMRSYRATAQAAQYAKGGSATEFHDMPRLAVLPDPSIQVGGATQYENLCASRYSGTMAKVVQILMGYGKTKAVLTGVQVKYQSLWSKTHGIATASDGRKWLVEISQENGVIAMRLPMYANNAGIKSPATHKQDVIKQTYLLLGGFPTGETFPAGTALTDAIAAGTVLQLLSVAGMSAFFGKWAPNYWLGWSFNNAGSEAHNTCIHSTNDIIRGMSAGTVTGYHYKVDISIGVDSGTASLVEVESGNLLWGGPERAFAFYDPANARFEQCPGKEVTTIDPALDAVQNTPIFVCHINDTLEVVRIRSNGPAEDTTTSTGESAPYGATYRHRYITDTRRYVTSTTYPDAMNIFESENNAVYTEHLQNIYYADGLETSWANYTRTDERFATSVDIGTLDVSRLSHAIWSPISRDCYTLDRDFGDKYTRTVQDNLHFSKQSDRRYATSTSFPDGVHVVQHPVTEPTTAVWAQGVWSYEPTPGDYSGAGGTAIIDAMKAAIAATSPIGSGGYSYPTAESDVTVYDRNAGRPLVVLTAPGHTVNPANVGWQFGFNYDWDNIQTRTIAFDVRYNVFGALPQIAYPASTVNNAPTAVTGTAFLTDPTPQSPAVKYSFVGYI